MLSESQANCPECGVGLEDGYVMTQQKQNILLPFYSCSDVYFCRDPKMGFFSVPKGENVSGRKVKGRFLAIPAKRCQGCRLVLFHY